MTYVHFIGIDVSKESFDVALYANSSAPQRFQNSSEGVEEFASAYATHLAQAFVVLEATGGYEATLLAALVQRQVAVHRADPRASSYFLRSLGKRAKTDAIDAAGLARYAYERHGELRCYRLPGAASQALRALSGRRADLVAMRAAERNRSRHPHHQALRASTQRILQALSQEIALLEEEIGELIRQSGELTQKEAVMTAIPGVGKQTAQTLLAFMPELGTLTRRQAAALAGCAPHPRDSGKTSRYRPTVGGRAQVKRMLFMAAMAARNFNPKLKEFYENLIKNGKKPMLALTAVMRKLITIINAKLRDHRYAKTW